MSTQSDANYKHYNVATMPEKELPASADIVIVGSGMSGLYIAWRLLRENPDRDICIVDKINRTGGRLDSDRIKFDVNGEIVTVKEEQGGMRFTFDTMDDLMSLFLMLELESEIVPFPMNSGGNNRLYFRGQAFTNEQATHNNYAIWGNLYDLNSSERGIDPKSIINTVFNRILSVNPDFPRPELRTPEFWQGFRLDCQWNDVKLNNWTLWNLLVEMGYSNECVTLLYRLLGFNGTFLSEMNAGEAFQLLEDFPADPQFRTLKEGFSCLPNALVDAVGMDKIHLCTMVESLDANNSGGYQLACVNPVTGERNTLVAREKVILALPRLALEKLFVRSKALNQLELEGPDALWDTLQTTTNQALLKINLYYERAWWGNKLTGQPPVSFGPNFSDLPLGSVYPFYAIDDDLVAALEYRSWLKSKKQPVPPELEKRLEDIDASKFKKPAALTIYCDFLNINFWRALQANGPKFESEMQNRYNLEEPQTIYPASQAVVKAATNFFKHLFNTNYVPNPTLTSTRIWAGTVKTDAPPSKQVGYGVHQWGLGADDRETMAALVEPVPGIFTCGEAYSDYQGWVEGALRSADRVLETFGLKPISEVYQAENHTSSSCAIKRAYNELARARIAKLIGENPGEDINICESSISEGYDIQLTYLDQ